MKSNPLSDKQKKLLELLKKNFDFPELPILENNRQKMLTKYGTIEGIGCICFFGDYIELSIFIGLGDIWDESLKINRRSNYASYNFKEESQIDHLKEILIESKNRVKNADKVVFDRYIRDENLEEETDEHIDGALYVLDTLSFTASGQKIYKVGISSKYIIEDDGMITVDDRIDELYRTGSIYRYENTKYTKLFKKYKKFEKSMHGLLDKFRVNQSREYFTEDFLPLFLNQIDFIEKNNLDE